MPTPVPAHPAVSEALDALSQEVGSILCRGPDGWVVIPAGAPGQVLTSNGEGDIPSWQDP